MLRSPWLLVPFACLACNAVPADPAPREAPTAPGYDLVLDGTEPLSGLVEADDILVPAGAVVRVEADCHVRATGRLTVAGRIELADGAHGATPDAPDLLLEAGQRLHVQGSVHGGNGFCWGDDPPEGSLRLRGGAGSDVTLAAPELLVSGLVTTGDGGSGGLAAPGGPGGSLRCYGRLPAADQLTTEERRAFEGAQDRIGYVAGSGGMGGMGSHELQAPASGPSGDSGDILHLDHADFPGLDEGAD